MLRKEAKEVVCKYCNKVFKTRKAKEFFALIIVDMKLTYSPCLKAGDSWIQTILAY